MSRKNLFKWMFVALFAFAATAFTGCTENNEDIKAPELSIAPTVLNFDELGGHQTVELTANCDWEVTFDSTAENWVDIQPLSGSGNATLTVTTYEKSDDRANKVTVYFTLYHSEYGKWGKAKSTLTINQTYGGEPIVEDVFYFNNFDAQAAEKTYGSGSSWPFLDQFEEGWKGHTGTGVENVDYDFSGMSLRNNSNSNGSYSDVSTASGVNNLFFGTNAYFTIENIALTSNKVNLSFMGEKYQDASDNLFKPEEFTITLSADGQSWSNPIEYNAPESAGRWNMGDADFTLPEGTTTLWIKFACSVASAYRIDDVKVMGGVGGQSITFDGTVTPDPGPGTSDAEAISVQDFLAAADTATTYQLTGKITRVVNTTYGNFDLTDETGTVYVYGLLTPAGEAQKQWAAAGLKQGDKITVKGVYSEYNGQAQIKNAIYVSHEAGEGGGNEQPDQPVTPAEGEYASDSNFVSDGDMYSNPCGLGDVTVNGSAVTGFKLGTGKLTGVFSATAGTEGDKYLNFYAVAWKGKTATLYVRVDGTQVGSFELAANDGATGNPPFVALAPATTDHYSVKLTGLTASSTIEFSTSANYAVEDNTTSGRAIVFGVKLTDEALAPEQGGGQTPEEPEQPEDPENPEAGSAISVADFLAAADTATTYELTGEITRVVNETYGNFDLTDATGTIYVYGLLTPDGQAQKQWAAAGLKQGDKITVKGVYSEYNGQAQIKNAIYVSHEAGEGGGNEEPEQPVTPAEGEYASDSCFVSDGDQYANPSGLGDVTVNGSPVTGFKLGTGKKTGLFTSTAVGVEGTKTLSFYAVAWKGKSATLYVRVDGQQVGSFTLAANDGATGNPPFVALTPAASDKYSVELTGLTASSKVEFSTSANYAVEDNTTSGRAIVFGAKLN